MRRDVTGSIVSAVWAVVAVSASGPLPAGASLVASPDGITVYDSANNVGWLADADLAATNRFGLPLCNATTSLKACVNPGGSMTYQSAAAWVAGMNASRYLGHTNWQLPTTPSTDTSCPFVGPHGESFGFNCTASALGSLYYTSLGLNAPNSAVPSLKSTAGPFSNFQPYLYWSQTSVNGTGYGSFSFNSGFHGSNTIPNYLYVLPMIQGKIPGAPAVAGTGLQVNPSGQTVYDPVTKVTWLANANVAATNTFGLPACKDQGTPKICVNADGAMNWSSASQLVANMNSGTGYLGQTNWELPPMDPACDASYRCASASDPMGSLFYSQLGLSQGMPVVPTPNAAVGPFRNVQPYLYWACEGATIQSACQTTGPASGFQWSFSFGNGFEGTDVLGNDLYATAYFVGPPTLSAGPEIAEVENAEGESPAIAPNTWIAILGAHLAPAGDTRVWQTADFAGNRLPTQLDGVSVTVNGKSAYVYYISPTQINLLTPPDGMSGPAQVVVTNGSASSAAFATQAQALSPSFFLFNGGYVAAVHLNGSLVGPTTLYPGSSTPAVPGETLELYANGFGVTNVPVQSGVVGQSGTLPVTPVIKIGGVNAVVTYAGLVSAGEYQFNVVVPTGLTNGDQAIMATYGGLSTPVGVLIAVHQ